MNEEDNKTLSKIINNYYVNRDLINPADFVDKINNDKTINDILEKIDFEFDEYLEEYFWKLFVYDGIKIFDTYRSNGKYISSDVMMEICDSVDQEHCTYLINFLEQYNDIIEIDGELIKFLLDFDNDLHEIYCQLVKVGKIKHSDNNVDNKIICRIVNEENKNPFNNKIINFIIEKKEFVFTEILSEYFLTILQILVKMNDQNDKLIWSKSNNFFKKYTSMGKTFGSEIIIKISDKIKNKSYDSCVFIKFLEYFHNSIEINNKLIKYLLIRNRYYINDFLELIINKIDSVDEETVALLIDNDNYKIYTELVKSEKFKPTVTHLEWACGAYRINPKLIEFILTHKIIPSHKCCELLMKKEKNPVYKKHEDIEFRSPYLLTEIHNYNPSDILSSLINCGLSITLDDIKKLAIGNIEVKNFKDLDIQTDKELVMICLENFRFRFNYFDKFDFQEILPELFKHVSTLQDLKLFIGNKKYKYNSACLTNACNRGQNTTIIKFLLREGVIPDLECLKNTIHMKGTSINNIRVMFDAMYENMKKPEIKEENKDEKPKKNKKKKK